MNTTPFRSSEEASKRSSIRLCPRLFTLLFVLAIHSATAAESQTGAAAKAAPEPSKPAEIVFPKSVFADDSPTGKDPFFPNSTRRNQTLVRHDTNTVVQPPPLPVVQLALKGISRSSSKPLALINNATFAAGETGEVRCGPQLVKLRCLEIRDHSALVEILSLNEVRELKLREGI